MKYSSSCLNPCWIVLFVNNNLFKAAAWSPQPRNDRTLLVKHRSQFSKIARFSKMEGGTSIWVPSKSKTSNTNFKSDEEMKEFSPTRRDLLLGLSSATAATAVISTVPANNISPPIISTMNPRKQNTQAPSKSVTMSGINEIVEWINQNCDRRFLHAIVSSDYEFLYRGASLSSNKAYLSYETPDLLDEETYGEKSAQLYFQTLEKILEAEKVKPSNGHLMTTSIRDASLWGPSVVSVWPLECSHYAWFQDEGLFYPRTDPLTRDNIIIDGRDCGKNNLEDALRSDACEIMVSSPNNSFLFVPVELDEKLRNALQSSFLI